jgi:hypothetical protein
VLCMGTGACINASAGISCRRLLLFWPEDEFSIYSSAKGQLLWNVQITSKLPKKIPFGAVKLQLGVNNIFSKTIMESNVYLRFSIAIFPVNVSWQYKLFKRYRLGFLAKHFCTGRFLEDEVGPITRRNMIYIIAKIPPIYKMRVHNHVKVACQRSLFCV